MFIFVPNKPVKPFQYVICLNGNLTAFTYLSILTNHGALTRHHRATHPPAGLPPVFAVVVRVIVQITEGQRDEVLSGRRIHPLIGADNRSS